MTAVEKEKKAKYDSLMALKNDIHEFVQNLEKLKYKIKQWVPDDIVVSTSNTVLVIQSEKVNTPATSLIFLDKKITLQAEGLYYMNATGAVEVILNDNQKTSYSIHFKDLRLDGWVIVKDNHVSSQVVELNEENFFQMLKDIAF